MAIQQSLAPGKYKLTVDDVLRLDASGVFDTSRTELLDGDIIIMNAEYRPHGRVRDEIGYRLRRALEVSGSNLAVMGASVKASDHDLPLPDIVLTREPDGDGPIPLGSVALIVEIASTTLHRDLGDKVRIYAAARVPEYWVADVNRRVVHRMWAPEDQRYAERDEVAFGDRLDAVTIAGLGIETDAL